jgi:hypothetical protein
VNAAADNTIILINHLGADMAGVNILAINSVASKTAG